MSIFLRKAWHLLGLVFVAPYFFGWLGKKGTLAFVGAVLVIAGVLEVARFLYPPASRAFAATFRVLLRREEYGAVNATLPYLAATFATVLLYPRVVAGVAVAYLAVGDVAAELVGRALGGPRLWRRKTLAGTSACLASCFLLGAFVFPWPAALAGAAVAALAELLSPGAADNFTIPLAAGAVLWLAAGPLA